MKYSLKDCAQIILIDLYTDEICSVHGFSEDIQNEVGRLIKIRNGAKRKRIRNKINKKIDKLLKR